MYERILVPIDGSEYADAAVEHAVDIAKQYGAEIHVLNVVDARVSGQVSSGLDVESAGVDSDTVVNTMTERGEEVVESVAERIRESGVEATTVVASGVPEQEIHEYAESEGCDLIVMGTHGRTGLDRYLLGSVTERTVRTSEVPVMTVRSDG